LRSIVAGALTFLTLATSLCAAADEPYWTRFRTALQDAGIATTTEGLAAYLRLYCPGSEQQAQYVALLRQLGDDDFFRREAALQTLERTPILDATALEAAGHSDDPEIRWR
jgi:hypothetical protein